VILEKQKSRTFALKYETTINTIEIKRHDKVKYFVFMANLISF